MDIEHYKFYSSEDFILDDDFIKLTKGYSIDGVTLDKFKLSLPAKAEEIAFAIDVINGLKTNKGGLPHERKEEILSNIFKRGKTQFSVILLRYAAVAMLLLGIGTLTKYYLHLQDDMEDIAILPITQSENSELILANGKRVEIVSKQSKIEYNADGSHVSVNDSARMEQTEPLSGKSYNQLIVPYGSRSNILLSDGTQVWLNSGSRLVYPPAFEGKTREVFLDGEAYFEVSKNANRPFFVRTEEFRVKVLGTKFCVNVYQNENEHSTVLIEGKVAISKNGELFNREYQLSPNQKATITLESSNFNISEVDDAQQYISWINGYLIFENEDFESLSKKISRYYNLEIEINTRNVHSRFSGKLDLKKDPIRIMDGLSTIFNLKYEKQGDKILIYE